MVPMIPSRRKSDRSSDNTGGLGVWVESFQRIFTPFDRSLGAQVGAMPGSMAPESGRAGVCGKS